MRSIQTPEKREKFLAALAETPNVSRACLAACISKTAAFTWRKVDPDFAAAWEEALKVGVTALEEEVHRRAFEGYDEPVYYQGATCGVMRKYSDTLAIFLLKSHNPAKYRENTRMELTGADGGPVQVTDADRAHRLAGLLSLAEARKRGEDASDLV
jgi:hypothetical protein